MLNPAVASQMINMVHHVVNRASSHGVLLQLFSGYDECREEVDHNHAPVLPDQREHFIGNVTRVITDRPGTGM